MDNQQIRDTNQNTYRGSESEWNSKKANKNLLLMILGSLVLITVAILFFVLSDTSHYEKGMQYLQQKQYSEAQVEFQKVDPDEKDFRMAQSKINYLTGLRAFTDNMRPQAIASLSKVEPADEYYHDSQLMIDKLKLAENNLNLESLNSAVQNSKDTIILKEKIIERSPSEVQSNETHSDDAINRTYASTVDHLVSSFQSLYQSASTAQGVSKKEYQKNMDSVYNELLKTVYTAKEKNPILSEFHSLAANWMQKSLTYINSQIIDNTVSGEPNNSKYKSDEEKAYTLLINHLKKVKGFYSI